MGRICDLASYSLKKRRRWGGTFPFRAIPESYFVFTVFTLLLLDCNQQTHHIKCLDTSIKAAGTLLTSWCGLSLVNTWVTASPVARLCYVLCLWCARNYPHNSAKPDKERSHEASTIGMKHFWNYSCTYAFPFEHGAYRRHSTGCLQD